MSSKNRVIWLSVWICAVTVAVLVSYTPVVKNLAWRIIDWQMNFFKGVGLLPQIEFICIDDNSINILGRFPWDRRLYGILLSGMEHFPPDVIGFDFLFTEFV